MVTIGLLLHADHGERIETVRARFVARGYAFSFADFVEQDKDGEFLFERGGMKVPFPALSDGYRAYVGWIADLLFHVCHTCPSGKKLVENRGIVMVDEIDLHLHPKWQRVILPSLIDVAAGLGQQVKVQIITATHSPLVLASLEPLFDPELDRLFLFELNEGKVMFESRPWTPHGDVVGWLTSEELWWDAKGALQTHAPSTYKIPTARDWPARSTVTILERSPNRQDTIYRSKAVGEPPLMLAMSVFHAIRDACAACGPTGSLPHLTAPATPESVLRAIDSVSRSHA